ncbi:MAG: patatin-like phospholipase family protein [Cytophagales bacterium]|nr:patatin-like phospholipase family protein [Bernardetiaceae bacterium]MDW8209756.1 patatin-like phospholipase family protein [Cytophagales bacterium]
MAKKVALVLSSGGSRGLAQAGAIQILQENGFQITSVAGSSIGALIGGLFAMGKLNSYTQWLTKLNKRHIWELIDFTLAPHGLIKAEKVFDTMKTFIPDMPIEDMPIPFAAVATDILNQKAVVFTSGSFYQAIRASIAIPAVITPVKYGDTFLVDGGILNPIPIQYVPKKGDEWIAVVNLYGERSSNPLPKKQSSTDSQSTSLLTRLARLSFSEDRQSLGYYSLVSAASSAMIKRIAQLTLAHYPPDILINIPEDSAGTFEFFKAAELIQLGRELATKALAEAEEKLSTASP